MDNTDSSVTRPRALIIELIKKAGLRVVKEQKQQRFPNDLYEVRMFAIQPVQKYDDQYIESMLIFLHVEKTKTNNSDTAISKALEKQMEKAGAIKWNIDLAHTLVHRQR